MYGVIGAEESSTIRASDFVPAGSPVQWMDGLTPGPWQVNLAGMGSVWLNAWLVTVIAVPVGMDRWPPTRPHPLTRAATVTAATAPAQRGRGRLASRLMPGHPRRTVVHPRWLMVRGPGRRPGR